ncbi:hypothetical protein RND81_11G191600 [Saponaria officinalis]|uniref:DUF8039 domain-containing protein n=1 Tax=Saponaria officinalis TaxID=3572 RepID=A0AAW1HNV9_SAPOF
MHLSYWIVLHASLAPQSKFLFYLLSLLPEPRYNPLSIMDDNNDYSCDDYNDDEDSEDAIDDAPYDDELEEDIGDPEDIADEIEECLRFQNREGVCAKEGLQPEGNEFQSQCILRLINSIVQQFHIPDEKRLRKNFFTSVAKRFRDFKSKLVSGWITKTRKRSKFEDGREPHEIWKHIKVEDRKLFQQLKNSSPAKKKREKAVECAKKNEHYHRLGQNDFNAARSIWIKDGYYPGSTPTTIVNSTITVDVNRADDWFCAMHSKDKKTGQYVIKKPETKEVAEKYIELRGKQVKGDFTGEGSKDALYYALGEKDDHPSRARGFGGVNMSVKFAFGDQMGNNKRMRKSRASLEDREALKNEIREELRNEMKEQVRSSVSSILHKIGVPAVDKLTFDRLSDSGGGTETCLIKAQKQPGPSLQQKFKNDNPCRLLLKDPHSGVIYEVARGKTFPGEVCHQGSVGPDEIRVKVSIVPQEFESLPLPVPVSAYDLYLLRDAVGSFVPWPIALLRLDDEGELKDKEVGIMGSNSHYSKLSATPKKAPTRDSIVESLSQDCQWLNSLVGTMGDGETYTVHFDVNLFYYSKETKIEVYKDDLKQFIKGCELNISII